MNSQDFLQFQQETLAFASGANIHDINIELHHINISIELLSMCPDRKEKWSNIIKKAKIKISFLLNLPNDYEYYYCKGYSRF